MIVRVTVSPHASHPAALTVEQPDDCTSLAVHSTGDSTATGAALAELAAGGPGEDGHVWLHIDVLRGNAEASAASPNWAADFTSMIAYAERSGWTNPDKTAVRAHVVADVGRL